LLDNPIYKGTIKSGEITVQGNFDAIVSEELWLTVRDVIHGKRVPVPHKRVSEDFPLRGFVRCAACDKPLTAGWAKGRNQSYARYWCYTPGCKGVGISRDGLESHFVQLLAFMQPTAELLAMLPDIAQSTWQQRTERITGDRKQLLTRLGEQETLNRKAIAAKLTGDLSPEDFTAIKQSITETKEAIETQLKSLDSERCTIEDLMAEARVSVMNLAKTWLKAGIAERQELQRTLFPDGLRFSADFLFFEPRNHTLMQSVSELVTVLVNDGRGERI
jgi:site-specific DNA recombinase